MKYLALDDILVLFILMICLFNDTKFNLLDPKTLISTFAASLQNRSLITMYRLLHSLFGNPFVCVCVLRINK